MGNQTLNMSQLDQIARMALNKVLAQSIIERKEYGAMIYLNGKSVIAMPPRTQGDPTTVDVGQHEPNCSCPPGTTPVAYYHTHPTYSVGGVKADFNEFSPEDMEVAKDYGLAAAYAGTLDGSFLKYDPKTDKTIVLSGKLNNAS
jgi:Domain of unknown function (DUF4329)